MSETVLRERKPLRNVFFDAAMSILRQLERVIVNTSLVPTTPFLDKDVFPWSHELEAHWRDIRAELDGLLVYKDDLPAFHSISGDVTHIKSDDWKTYFFYGYGFKAEANLARCPRTAALLARIPGLTTAFFSILAPGTRIPPHRGPWKGVLRYHLALKVPEPRENCAIKIDGQVAHWKEGQGLLFDDSFEHSVWNDTNGTRVVLFLDVLRPCRAPGSWINRAVIKAASRSPFLEDARRKHNKWERAFEAKHGAAVPVVSPPVVVPSPAPAPAEDHART